MTEQTPPQESVGTEDETSASSSHEATNSTISDQKDRGSPNKKKKSPQ